MLCTGIYTHTYIHTYIHPHTQTYSSQTYHEITGVLCTSTHTPYIHTYIHTSTHTSILITEIPQNHRHTMYRHTYTHIHTYIYTHKHTHHRRTMYRHTHIHTHTHTQAVAAFCANADLGTTLSANDRLRVAVTAYTGTRIAALLNKNNPKWLEEATARAEELAKQRKVYKSTMHTSQSSYAGGQNGDKVPPMIKKLWEISKGASPSNPIHYDFNGIAVKLTSEIQTWYLNRSKRNLSDIPTVQGLLGRDIWIDAIDMTTAGLMALKLVGMMVVIDMHSFSSGCLSPGVVSPNLPIISSEFSDQFGPYRLRVLNFSNTKIVFLKLTPAVYRVLETCSMSISNKYPQVSTN
jgi:hypothetical protein